MAKVAAKVVCLLLLVGIAIIGVLLSVALVRALTLEEIDYQEADIDPGERDHIPESYLKGLPKLMSRALAIPTVSTAPGDYDREALGRFHVFLREAFPHVFNSSVIDVEVVNKLSLLLSVKGQHDDLLPYMLMGHLDVVPVDKTKWARDPWGGEIVEDEVTGETFIWGRGAFDNKAGVMGIMVALEYLAMTDFQPERSFYVALGHDEEVQGADGAGHIAKVLEDRGVRLDFILDEGVPMCSGIVAGVEGPLALIGVTEKGWLQLELEAEGQGGHSSIPPKNSAVTRLSRALVALEENPQPVFFGGVGADMLSYIAAKASWPYRLVYSNLWLFRPIIKAVMSSKRETDALIRTTTSATIVRAGVKVNVVPATATATINHRIHPSQSIREVIQYDKNVIADPSIKVTIVKGMEPHPVSPFGPESNPWRLISAAVHHHYPTAVTAPGVLMANTDSKHYLNRTSTIYRFVPVLMYPEDLPSIHGKNERISIPGLALGVRIYHRIMVWGAHFA